MESCAVSNDKVLTWIAEGNGFAVTFLDYPAIAFPIQMRDVYEGAVEIWKDNAESLASSDFYSAVGRSRDPSVYGPLFKDMLKMVEGDQISTLEITNAAHRLVCTT